MNYKLKSDEILEKRNAYYRRRKKLITSFSLSIVFITVILSGYFSFFNLINANKPFTKEYFYQKIEVQVTSSSSFSNFNLSNLETIDEIMQIINQKYNNSLNDNRGLNLLSDYYFEEQIDYLLKVSDKNGKDSFYCITPNYILSEQFGNVRITKNEYNLLKTLLSEK